MSLILSLSLLHSSFAPVLSLLLTYPLFFFFFFFFHFPTLCELLRTRHVFNELQVARSDSFRESISWACFFFSSFPFNFACVGSHDRVWNFILFLFFSSSFLSPFSSSLIFLFFYTTRSVASVRSVHLTRSAIISLVPAWHLISLFVLVRSRPVCSLFRSFPVISSSEVRCASLRVVMPPHY